MVQPASESPRDVAEALFSSALAGAAAAVSSSLQVEQVLDQILEQVSYVVPSDTCNIMLIEGDGARIVRWRGYEALGISNEDLAKVRPAITVYCTFRAMVETRQPVVVGDTQKTAAWVTAPGRVDHRSYVELPSALTARWKVSSMPIAHGQASFRNAMLIA